MTPDDIKNYYKSGYKFHKATGMSQSTYRNWRVSGKIPLESQAKLNALTNGKLIVSWETNNGN